MSGRLDDYDFSEFDRKFEALLTVGPQAIVLLDIRFTCLNGGWMPIPMMHRTILKTRRNTYDDVQALGSKHWLEACEAPLKSHHGSRESATPVAEREGSISAIVAATSGSGAARLLVRIFTASPRKPVTAARQTIRPSVPCCVAVTRRMPH